MNNPVTITFMEEINELMRMLNRCHRNDDGSWKAMLELRNLAKQLKLTATRKMFVRELQQKEQNERTDNQAGEPVS